MGWSNVVFQIRTVQTHYLKIRNPFLQSQGSRVGGVSSLTNTRFEYIYSDIYIRWEGARKNLTYVGISIKLCTKNSKSQIWIWRHHFLLLPFSLEKLLIVKTQSSALSKILSVNYWRKIFFFASTQNLYIYILCIYSGAHLYTNFFFPLLWEYIEYLSLEFYCCHEGRHMCMDKTNITGGVGSCVNSKLSPQVK